MIEKALGRGCLAMEQPWTECISTWLMEEALGVRGQVGVGCVLFRQLYSVQAKIYNHVSSPGL